MPFDISDDLLQEENNNNTSDNNNHVNGHQLNPSVGWRKNCGCDYNDNDTDDDNDADDDKDADDDAVDNDDGPGVVEQWWPEAGVCLRWRGRGLGDH